MKDKEKLKDIKHKMLNGVNKYINAKVQTFYPNEKKKLNQNEIWENNNIR